MKDHKHYKLAYNAYTNMSFNPERRAESVCKMYDEHISELTNLNADLQKYERLFTDWIYAESRCASSAVVGPARFPADRNRKRMDSAMKKWDLLVYFVDKARNPKKYEKTKRTELDYKIEQKEYKIGDILVEQNTTDNRLQLFFPDKPDDTMRDKLKKNGFKWSPKNKAWQRQLTPNAIRTVSYIFNEDFNQ